MKNALVTILTKDGFTPSVDNSHFVKTAVISVYKDGSDKALVALELFIDEDNNNKISHKITATWETLEDGKAITKFVRENLRLVDTLNSLNK